MVKVLGQKVRVAGYALQGICAPEDLVCIMRGVIELIGMTTGGLEPIIRQYPLPNGKGGLGHTIFLPMGVQKEYLPLKTQLALWLLKKTRFSNLIFQPLVESFIAADDYIELNKTCVLVVSCLPFNSYEVGRYLAKRIGPFLSRGEFIL